MEDRVRVLRIIEYIGDRSEVERQIERSLHGRVLHTYRNGIGPGVEIRAATLGEFPEILERGDQRIPPVEKEGA